MNSRHPQLRAPLFSALASACLTSARLPPGGTGDEDDDDEEAGESLARFREHLLAELFEACYAQLRSPLLTQLLGPPLLGLPAPEGAPPQAAQAAGGAPDGGGSAPLPPPWANVEAALFCLRSLAVPLRERCLGDRSDDDDDLDDRAASNAFLCAVFARLGGTTARDDAGPNPFTSHPLVVTAACRAVGAYAPWLGRGGGGGGGGGRIGAQSHAASDTRSIVIGATGYLLRALSSPGALHHASNALRGVCARCPDTLCDLPVLASLIATAHASLPGPPPPRRSDADEPCADDRIAVIEGLARLVADARLPPSDAAPAALALVSPILSRCDAALATEPAGDAAAHSLASDLGLLAAAIRFLEKEPPPAPSPRAAQRASQLAAASLAASAAAAPAAASQPPGADAASHPPRAPPPPPPLALPPPPPPPPLPPALAVLRAAWPALRSCGERPSLRARPPVVSALCDVYARAFRAAPAGARPLLAPACASLGAAWAEGGHASCCDALAAAVEVYAPQQQHVTHAHSAQHHRSVAGENGGGGGGGGGGGAAASPQCDECDAVRALGDALAAAALAAGPLAAAGRLSPDGLRSLLELGHRAALFAPQLILRPDALSPLFAAAVAGVAASEREPCRAAACLLSCLLSPGRMMAAAGPAFAAARPALSSATAAHGRALVSALMDGVAATAPKASVPALGGVLFHFLRATHPDGAALLAEAVRSPDHPSAAVARAAGRGGGSAAAAAAAAGPSPVGDAEKAAFLDAALRAHNPLPQHRFEALVADYGGVCRREESADALGAYA